MNPPPPPPPNPTSFTNPSSSFPFLPPTPPNPNFFQSHLHHRYPPSSSSTVTLPSCDDLPTTLSTLKDLIRFSETTIDSISTLLRTTPSDLSTCPFNPHHRVPPESLFRHSIQCPSSPATIDLTFLEPLRYPHTLQSSDELIEQNRFVRTLHNSDTELCFSLDQYGDFGLNFFYSDCPGVVTSTDQDGTNRMLTLPGVLSAECANFIDSGDREVKGFSKECLRLLPSELWAVRSETMAWNDYPTSYSYGVLRAILSSHTSKECHWPRWVTVNSPRYGLVIDLPMGDHIVLLFRLCLNAIAREAIGSADLLFNREVKEWNLNTTNFKCPILVQVLTWLASQLSVLYGELNGKFFAVEMLKQCILNASLNSSLFSDAQECTGSPALKEVDGKVEVSPEKSTESRRYSMVGESTHSRVIFVSQVAAAVAALHERSLLEEKIKVIWESQPLTKYQRMAEHAYVSKRAGEERQKRTNYRPILEHDGLLWQSRNQETNKMKTREELLAEERDYKRRRMSYRGKKLKRTTTQVMRDIIDEYMEEIKLAGGIGCLIKGAVDAGTLASEPFSVHKISADNQIKRSVPNSSEVTREWPHGYGKQLLSHNNFRSTRFDDEAPEDNKKLIQDPHWHHGHLEAQRRSDGDRHGREYYSRISDGQRRNGHCCEQISNQGHPDNAEVSRKYFPQSSDKSHSRSHERTSH